MKNLQDLKISANSANSLCTTNRRNRPKVEKTFYNCQVKGWIISFNTVETSFKCTKQQNVESDQFFT